MALSDFGIVRAPTVATLRRDVSYFDGPRGRGQTYHEISMDFACSPTKLCYGVSVFGLRRGFHREIPELVPMMVTRNFWTSNKYALVDREGVFLK